MSEKTENEEVTENKGDIISMLGTAMDKPDLRVTGIYGDINEERCSEAVMGLLALELTALSLKCEDPKDLESEMIEVIEPIDFYVSTYGGQALEMFAVYDTMRKVREETPIRTYGLGKVMSAGVLLLAAGTKGERRIGKFCRIMIHGVIAGQHGHIADVENEFTEAKMTQKMYVRALAEETTMTEKYVKKLMDRKTNVYLDAEEAVKLGIADIIF
jgi:ATP-dependent Clp endopeptidase proteolytic subunit ClpP